MTAETTPAKVRLSAQLGPAAEARCMCGEMLLSACHGEWEPGCDLGNNPAHVRPARAVLDTDEIEVLREALAVAWGDLMTAQLKSNDQADELAGLRRDAKRYRSIRSPSCLGWPIAVFDIRHPMNKGKPLPYECVGDEFDLLVDAAMSAAPGPNVAINLPP